MTTPGWIGFSGFVVVLALSVVYITWERKVREGWVPSTRLTSTLRILAYGVVGAWVGLWIIALLYA